MEGTLCGAGDQPGLRLIETVYWDGARAPRWPLHLARLRAGASALGWGCPDLTPAGPDHPVRLRLTLDAKGRAAWEVFALPPAPVAPWRLVLSPERLDPDDPWLRIKSTHRALYDQTRAALPEGADEVIFANTRGELCEGTITTLFFDRGQGMRTPPLRCGLLPGVLRAELACPEEVLPIADLPHVKLWVGNALRGLIPANWQPCGT